MRMTTQTEDNSVCSVYSMSHLQPGRNILLADFPPVGINH